MIHRNYAEKNLGKLMQVISITKNKRMVRGGFPVQEL